MPTAFSPQTLYPSTQRKWKYKGWALSKPLPIYKLICIHNLPSFLWKSFFLFLLCATSWPLLSPTGTCFVCHSFFFQALNNAPKVNFFPWACNIILLTFLGWESCFPWALISRSHCCWVHPKGQGVAIGYMLAGKEVWMKFGLKTGWLHTCMSAGFLTVWRFQRWREKKEGAPVGCRGLRFTSLSLYIAEQNSEELKSSQIKPDFLYGSIGIFIKLLG